ncbi:MAG TPA: inositol-3-phosphate synthase, partial [Pirellulaceae bacterium]
TLVEMAEQLAADQRAISQEVLAACRRDLSRFERNIRPGTILGVGERITELAETKMRRVRESAATAIARIQKDLREFARTQRLRDIVVVNLASTEPPCDERALPRRWPELERLLEDPAHCPLGASSLYAIAALGLGYPYVNFTPSPGARPRAICELAELRQTCHAGCDGKTGETLLKSVLAPMMAQRHWEVMSWVGHNIFGNLDGKILDAADNKASKIRSKDQLLANILGYAPQTLVSIEYIQSLGEWKTAWDHVHFRGFLGTPMTLQFIWQGCDSMLAAPLVLDLVRFVYRARRNGDVGVLSFLGSFFKTPLGSREHAFASQFEQLLQWSRQIPLDPEK